MAIPVLYFNPKEEKGITFDNELKVFTIDISTIHWFKHRPPTEKIEILNVASGNRATFMLCCKYMDDFDDCIAFWDYKLLFGGRYHCTLRITNK